MTDTRHTVQEHAEQAAPGKQPAGEEQPPTPDASAPGEGDARPAPAEDGTAGKPSDDRTAAAERPHDDGVPAHPEDADEEALRGDVDELVAVAAQRDEYLALAQRTQADFENYRKRVGKESAAAHHRGVVKLANELLGALDNLDRALEEAGGSSEREDGDDPLLEGVRLVRSELHAALARVGIESFSPNGAVFDPAEHEAMAQQPVAGAQSGTVVEVFQPGYRLGASIIRPARVLVAA
ncbi:MAG: nucleotide exchange factor GrpE [Solirubrobacterales bacterium]